MNWDDLKNVLHEATTHTFGKLKTRCQDWFEDHHEEIVTLLKTKDLRKDRNALRATIRNLKNTWYQQKACEAEQYARENNLREFYKTINAVYGPRSKSIHPVKSKGGAILSSSDDIKDRWVEHFEELLNQPSNIDWSIIEEFEQRPIVEDLDNKISLEETNVAIKNTKLKKSSGPDGIIPEVLVYGGNALATTLLTLVNDFWRKEYLPADLVDSTICILFKKGNRNDCSNY